MKITEKIFTSEGVLLSEFSRECEERILYLSVEGWENVEPWKNFRRSVQILVNDEHYLWIE